MKDNKKIWIVIVVIILAIVVSLRFITSITAWDLLTASGTEREFLPIISSHTPATETPSPTTTNTPPPTQTPTPQSTAEATASQTSEPSTPSATPEPTAANTNTPEPSNTPTTPEPSATPEPTATNTPVPPNVIVIDHTSVELFDNIPEAYLEAAEDMHMLFIDRSVGANINDGLTCLSHPSHEEAPNHCSRWEHVAPEFSVDPEVVSWNRAGGYDRDNWDFMFWPEENDCNSWSDKVGCFVDMVSPIINSYDVVSFQFSYLAVADDSDIADQPGGYFWDNADYDDVYDQEIFEAQHPDKTILYWTTSLSRGIGTDVSVTFNEQMRDYAIANDKVLFDVADILAHDPDGNPCYDNRDGIPYDNGNNSENYPDDGEDLLAICQHYTTETDGGHLGSVSAGKIRVAKAFWVLMARLAGWDGNTN